MGGFDGSSEVLLDRQSWSWVVGGLVRREILGMSVWNTLKSGARMKDSILKTGSSSMLHGLRAKGSAAALINSKNPMWPVAEFSRSRMVRR